jgi:D-glycero-D-manno-heptose 1,7-bisphosphate phosphatase
MRQRHAVFLDRDGVVNRAEVRDGKPYAPRRVQDFRLLPGAAGAVRLLRDAGFLVVVITNQPDIANGYVAAPVVEAMHQALRRRLPIDAIEMCPHGDADGCRCRKPQPGLLVDAADRLGIDLKTSFMVGDRAKDVLAGRAVGCYTVFIDRGYREPKPPDANAVVRSLPAAARHILAVTTLAQNVENPR